MTTLPPTRLSDDARLELAGIASATARQNRPLWLIVLGGLLMVVAVIYALYGFYQGGVAGAKLASQARRTSEVRGLVDQIKAIKASDAAGNERYRPDPQLVRKIEQAATDVGLVLTVTTTEDDKSSKIKNFSRRRIAIEIKGQPAEPLMTFLQRASDIQGLELAQIRLTPGQMKTEAGQTTWDASIQMTRWERP
ncbi:MAG: hypothetical protein IBJ18_13160 [Phycisphaerales bacterium]|nr:hypothetical protein [Phycisphaerales bacterium]